MAEPQTTDEPLELDTLPEDPVLVLTDSEHIKFVQKFQASYDEFYSSPAARIRGSQKHWVLRNVLGGFRRKFGTPSKTVISVCGF
jgi:hypothetical protein